MKFLLIVLTALFLPWSAQAHGDDYFDETSRDQCREFRKTLKIDGRKERAYGIACRDEIGQWYIVSDQPELRSHRAHKRFHRTARVYVKEYGFHIDLGKRYRRHQRNHYTHHPHRYAGWYGQSYLQAKRQYHRDRWRERGGNSYSLLIKRSRRPQ